MFEGYGFGAVAMQSQATLTLFAQGEGQVGSNSQSGPCLRPEVVMDNFGKLQPGGSKQVRK